MSALGNGNFIVPTGITACNIEWNGSKLVRTQEFISGEVIPGDGAYLIEANGKGDFTFILTTDEQSHGLGTTSLYPAIAGQTVTGPDESNTYKFYKLSRNFDGDAGSVGFYWGADNGGAFKFNSSNKAYLAIPAENNPGASIFLSFDDDTDGINGISASERSERGIYTLTGVRVDSKNLPKGIYIVNGKKQVVK